MLCCSYRIMQAKSWQFLRKSTKFNPETKHENRTRNGQARVFLITKPIPLRVYFLNL